MKKFYLLLLIGATALVSCGYENNSSTSESSSIGESSSSEVLESISLNYQTYTLNITNEVLNPTVTLTATINPTSFANETITWKSSNEQVAIVSEGVVTAFSVGTTTISATVLDKVATCTITVEKNAFDNIIDTTIPEFGTEELNQSLYRVSGVVENINSISNEFRLVETDGSGKFITVRKIGYSAQKEDDFVITDDKITYESPDVFENLEIEEGNYLTIVGIYFNYANAYYFDGYLEDITDGTEISYTVTVSINDNQYGSVSLSKEANIQWGEEIEIEATPNEGYAIGTITRNEIIINANEEGKYVFNASAKNDVKVTFVESKSIVKTYDFTNLGSSSFTNPSSEDYITLKNTGSNDPKFNYSSNSAYLCLILYGDSNKSTDGNSLDTIKDFGGNISKVVINAYGQKSGTFFSVYGTNDTYDAENSTRTWKKIGEDVSLETGTTNLAEYTITVDSPYKYIRIQSSGCTSSSTVIQTKITSVSYYVG